MVPGPEHHGAVRHGLRVATLVAGPDVSVTVTRSTEVSSEHHDLTHVQFTDALFGPEAASAADAFVRWACTAPRPVVVTLHDVPDGDDDTDRGSRRRRAYERVVATSDAVVVSTEHEATSARRLGGLRPVVVPLPVEVVGPPGPPPPWAGRRTVGVLGFVYPGKGHAEAIDAAARHAGEVAVVAIGAVSPGHGPLLEALREQARALDVELLVTGPVSDADLHAAALAVTVPLAAYSTTGASASLATWLACGRRPLAVPTPQVRELAHRWPGAVTVIRDGPERAPRVAEAVAVALHDPKRTWLDGPPPSPDVGAAHLAVYRRVLVTS